MVNGAVVTNLGGLAKDDAHAVVNEELVPDGGPRVNLDAGQVPCQLAYQPCQEKALMAVKKMRDLVCNQHMKAGIQQDHLQHIARGGVLVPDVFGVCPKSHDGPFLSHSCRLAEF